MFGFFGGRGVAGTIAIFEQTMGIPRLTVLAMTAEVFMPSACSSACSAGWRLQAYWW
jgi:hypothetical protein